MDQHQFTMTVDETLFMSVRLRHRNITNSTLIKNVHK
jgi:hypothetical protein